MTERSRRAADPHGLRLRDFTKLPLVMTALMFIGGAVVYPYLPSPIPTHWGISGQADAFSPKGFWSVFLIPVISLALYGLLLVVPIVDPKRANIAKSLRGYNIVLDAIIGLQVVIFISTTFAAFKPGFDVVRIMLLAMGAMFLVLGRVMKDVKQNFTIGVRVSWTLADEVVWEKTNRLGGRLFMGLGVVTFVAARPGAVEHPDDAGVGLPHAAGPALVLVRGLPEAASGGLAVPAPPALRLTPAPRRAYPSPQSNHACACDGE
jgi:uncharacterized membrane protein